MKKRELVRYVCSGGLRMYDDECSIRWHNMEADERTDWLVFFDMCRDEETPHTEAVIAAIMAGLCPLKKTVHRGGMLNWEEAEAGTGQEKLWLFPTGAHRGRQGFPVSESLLPPGHYLVGDIWRAAGIFHLIPAEKAEGHVRWLRRRRAVGVHAFKHPAHAWAFLLSFL